MEERGPFDRMLQSEPPPKRDRAATIVVGASVVLALLLLILVLPPASILDDDGPQEVPGPVTTTMRDEMPPPPPGFEAVSALFDLSTPGSTGLPARLTVNLSTSVSEGDPLALFTYQDGRWRRLAEANLVAEGEAARGEVPFLPGNVAVFRALQQARTVVGGLPAGAEVDPRALTALATLNPAGLSPSPDGRLSGGPLELPAGFDVDVAPTISATTPEAIDALNTILSSPDLLPAHVQAVLALAADGDFAGIDLDYRAIDPALGEAFIRLVGELAEGLHADGRTLTLALPLPVRAGNGWDTLGYDWQALASQVHAIRVLSEPEQDRYYARMEEALGFLTSRASGSKLLLTVSPLSRERGVDGVRTLTLTEALALASTPGLQTEGPVAPGSTVGLLGRNLAGAAGAGSLVWDDTARAVVFRYTGPGGERTVWMANVFSEAFKLDLARRYQLGGVAIEDVSRRTADANIWPAVVQYAQAGEVVLVKPNAELLQPRWTVSGGALDSDVGAQVTWRAPAEAGTYTITLVVSDGAIRVGQELEVPVGEAAGAASP